MCVCVSSCQLSGLWQSHLSMWALDQGNEAKKREVLSCLSELFNSVVSLKAPCRTSSDSLAQALLCQFSISPRQCQNCHTQSSWGTSGENPSHPRSNNKDQRLSSSPPGSRKCNELFGKDHDNLKLKWLSFLPNLNGFCTSLSSLHTEQVLLSGGSLTPAHFHILQTWLCLRLELFPATFFLRGSSATLRMLHLKTDASSCQQMQNGSSPCSVICPRLDFVSVAICNFFLPGFLGYLCTLWTQFLQKMSGSYYHVS